MPTDHIHLVGYLLMNCWSSKFLSHTDVRSAAYVLYFQVLCPDLVIADYAYPPDVVTVSDPGKLVSRPFSDFPQFACSVSDMS